MQKFLVKVNGREYEVEVETLNDKSNSPKNQEPEKGKEVAAASTVATAPLKEGRQVKAPLAGNILSIKVKTGDKIKRGDVLLTLEALKLENEITSPCDGIVLSVNTQIGSSVGTGDVLVVIKEQ